MDKASRSRVLLEALAKVPVDDALTAEKLLGLLLSQPAETLRKERDMFLQATDAGSPTPLVLRGAYGALMIGDGKPDQAWQSAVKHDGHLNELMLGVRYLPDAKRCERPALRSDLRPARIDRRCRHQDGGTRRRRVDPP